MICFFSNKAKKLRNNKDFIDQETLEILQTVGDPDKLQPNTPVCQPLTRKQYGEQRGSQEYTETYTWFVENDETQSQALPEILPGKTLPTLEQN